MSARRREELRVTANSILDLDEAMAADAKSLMFILEHMRSQDFHFDEHEWLARAAVPSIDKVAWRASTNVLRGFRSTTGFYTDADFLMHEGFHSLGVVKYGRELKGRPRFTLLMEAIASCNTPYLMLSKIHALGPDAASRRFLKECVAKADELGMSSRQQIQRDIKDPFSAYKRIAIDMFSLYDFMLKHLAKGDLNLPAFNRFWASKKNTMFYIAPFDLGHQVLYAQANCGLRSSKKDLALCRKILKDLRASDSYFEFLKTFAHS